MLGLKLGCYKIIDILGEGGMGVVYKALDVKLERYVAIKILNNQALNNPQFVERFKREAKNQAKLNHPNIVPVYGLTEENHVLGIVMEYVEGVTLEHLIESKKRLQVPEALDLLRQILSGAAYAHNKGFVHRDIKPSNIIVNKEGIAKIMDFGISKSLNETKGLTRTGAKLGTILYMSPEQIKAIEPTNQSDIYSIGITFYEMLNGKNPFDLGTDYQIMEAHLKMNPPRLSNMISRIGEDIDDIVARALNKSLKKRYQNCEEFIDDVDKLVSKINYGKTKLNQKLSSARGMSMPVKEPGKKLFNLSKEKAARLKFYLFAFVFILMFSGLVLFIYDAVSHFWKGGEPVGREHRGVVDSYKLNPGYMGASNWNIVSTDSKNQLNSIAFISDSVGIACGLNGTLLKTSDAGSTWYSLLDTLDEFGRVNFTDIEVTSSGIIISGDKGNILNYNVGDNKLSKLYTPVSESIFDMTFLRNNSVGFAVGANGTILKTNDGGQNWYVLHSPINKLLYKIFFYDNINGYIAGWDGTVLVTDNGGNSWKAVKPLTDKYLRDIYFTTKDDGVAAGGGGEIFITDNGGEDWEPVKTGIISGLYHVQFFNKKKGIILGSKGEILLTDDGGKNWKATSSGQFAGLTSLAFSPAGKIFIAGQNGVILKSSN